MRHYKSNNANDFFGAINFIDVFDFKLVPEIDDFVVEDDKGYLEFVVEIPVENNSFETTIKIREDTNVVLSLNSSTDNDISYIFNVNDAQILPLEVYLKKCSDDDCIINVNFEDHYIKISGYSDEMFAYIEGIVRWIVPE